MHRSASTAIAFMLALAVLSLIALGQDANFILNVDVGLVQLPVSVVDKQLRLVPDLQKNNFQVFEDGVAQQITLLSREDAPLSAGLVIDNSGSMSNKREPVNRAALAFARESNPNDETFIVNFNGETYLEQDFTSRIDELFAALKTLNTRGDTALYDAVHLSADHMRNGRMDKKALLLISDGDDTMSRYSFENAVEALKRSGATLYAIGLLDEDFRGRTRRRPPARRAREALQTFAEATGGVAYFPKSVNEVEEICKRIAHDLRSQYTIGYFSSNKTLDGKWRNVTVKLNTKAASQVTVRTKPGYYAPRAETEIKPKD